MKKLSNFYFALYFVQNSFFNSNKLLDKLDWDGETKESENRCIRRIGNTMMRSGLRNSFAGLTCRLPQLDRLEVCLIWCQNYILLEAIHLLTMPTPYSFGSWKIPSDVCCVLLILLFLRFDYPIPSLITLLFPVHRMLRLATLPSLCF